MASTQKIKPEWSKSYTVYPKDNLISHKYIKSKGFKSSYENDPSQPPMNLLLGWEYARIWEKEHQEYLKRRKEAEKPRMPKKREYKPRVPLQKKYDDDFLKRVKPKKQKIVCNGDEEKIKRKKVKENKEAKEYHDAGVQKDFCNCKCPKPVPSSKRDLIKPCSREVSKPTEEIELCCVEMNGESEDHLMKSSVTICFYCNKPIKPVN